MDFKTYISEIVLNNEQSINLNCNDIIVFVGPNNAGKSQSLKDIYALCESSSKQTLVVKSITIHKDSNQFLSYFTSKNLNKIVRNGNNRVMFLGGGFTYRDDSDIQSYYSSNDGLGPLRPFFVANLDTNARLTISNPPKATERNGTWDHPIHYATFEPSCRKWLSECFKRAFGENITPNTQFGSEIPLCIGKPVVLNGSYSDEQERFEAYGSVLAGYKQVQNQGDGIKSFTGILLFLMIDSYSVFLIDEPESFLHPPQANVMGRIIGERLSDNQQAFISTHSEELIKGLLAECPDRIKIIRITRNMDENSFSILDNQRISEVWNDPLLKHSNIMNSLFHQSVVLCESDSDCKFYSIISDFLAQSNGKYSETLFIHCGGKHRMAKISKALHSLGIEVKIISDIDLFDDKNVLSEVTSEFGIDWKSIEAQYNTFISNLHSPKETIRRKDFKAESERIIGSSQEDVLSKEEIELLCKELRTISKWAPLKKGGIAAIPSGDAFSAFCSLNQELTNHNIFIVPVGELERFVPLVGGHGPEWVNKVLEMYPDFSAGEYKSAREFLSDMDL